MSLVPGVVPDDLPEETKKRLPVILEGVMHQKSNEEIAVQLGVSKYVVDRDLLLWRRSDGYEVWVYEEFHRLHAVIADSDPKLAYRQMSALLGRLIGQKIKADIKAEGQIKVDVDLGKSIERILGEYEDVINKVSEEAIKRNIQKDGS